MFFVFSLSACGKKENLNTLSKNLTHYNILLDFDAENKTGKAKQSVKYVNNTGAILRNIEFHLYPQYFEEGNTEDIVSSVKLSDAYPNGIDYAEFNVDRLMIEGEDSVVNYLGEKDGILNVSLKNSLMPDEIICIEIEFSFKLANCLHRYGYGENTINLANFYPIACVYEENKFDEHGYNSNGDPFYSDMANYNVEITVLDEYIVAGTGDKTENDLAGDKKQVKFNAKVVRDFAMVISDKFEVCSKNVDNVEVKYYYFNDKNPEISLKAGVDSIKTFSDKFYKYPYKQFNIVEADFVYGGMEYPQLVMINTEIDNADDYNNVIIHETAHQWWYNIVGNDEYKYPWLDEAITEFSTILFYDYNDGYNLTHKKMIEANKSNYTMFVTVYNDVLGHVDTSMRAINEYDTEPEYTYCTYVKGVLMYDSLYNLIGEKKFINALKIYAENNKFKNATPKDIICAFEKSYGSDLDNFFDSWIKDKVVIR